MKRLLRSTLFGLTAAFSIAALPVVVPVASAQEAGRIAAIVNEEAITMTDVMGRLQLAVASSGLPDNVETRQRLLPQVLRLLIDETLQVQEARKREIQVTADELDQELADLAQRNRMTLDQFKQALAQAGIPFSTMRQQTIAHVAWGKLVQRMIRPTVQVSDDEVNGYIERIKANAGKPEYLVSEIFLSVDKTADERQVAQLAEQLVDRIGQGAPFAAVAQQFSQSSGAAAGGDLSWIQQGQLEDNLDRALQQLRPGQFSRPIRGASGYHILWLREQRTVAAGDPNNIQVSIRQFILPAAEGQDPTPQFNQAKQVVQEAASCPALEQASQRIQGAQLFNLPLTRMGDIPEQLRGLIAPLGVGTPTQPLVTDKGVMVLMVCDRVVPEGSTPPVDQVRNALFLERLDNQQRRYLRDLRRDADIQTRL